MAPPGIYTFNDCFDNSFTTISPFSTLTKLSSASSLPHSILQTLKSPPRLFSALWDHNYVIKPLSESSNEHVSDGYDLLEADVECGDAMVTNCNDDQKHGTDGCYDTEFLKVLEELNFSLEDLDPCLDIDMEDSVQDFIDSALEKSEPYFFDDNSSSSSVETNKHDPEIFSKEAFLAVLELRPFSEVTNSMQHSSMSLPQLSSLSLEKAGIDNSNFSTETPCVDKVPTKMCSCLDQDNISNVVYSMANESDRTCVHMYPCSSVANENQRNFCSQTMTNNLMLSSYSNISASQCSKSSGHSSVSQILIDKNVMAEVDKDTDDIMKWLNEIQETDQNQYSSGDNLRNMSCDGYTSVEETNHKCELSSPTILESFIDLEDFLTEADDTSLDQNINLDCSSQRMFDLPLGETQTSFEHHYSIPSRVSEEQLVKSKSDSCSHSQVNPINYLTNSHTAFTLCISPGCSATEFSFSTASSPLLYKEFSVISHSDLAASISPSDKQLTILKLFSDENSESLFQADSALYNS